MKPTTKKALFIVAIIAVLVLVYYSVFADAAPQESVPVDEAGTTVDPLSTSFPLKLNSRGENVKTWQDYIYTYLHGKSVTAARTKYVDGIYGPNTEADTAKVTGSKTVPLATFMDAIGGSITAGVAAIGSMSAAGATA